MRTLARILLEACERDDRGEFADEDEMVQWCFDQRAADELEARADADRTA
jgi:hypothetical protein